MEGNYEGNDYAGSDDAPRGNQLQRRGFSGMEIARQSAATDALIAKERASVEARWIMAMRQPRNMDDVRQMIMKECRRPGFADAAVYEVPRGDTKIVGLSIRFAEVAVRCMGNLQPETVTIYDDTESRIVRCTVTDYESNVTWSKDLTIRKTVERKFLKKGQRPLGERVNSYGDRVFIVEATDDDVATKEAAQVSKALRTLILRCIPGHIQDEALALCNAVYADKAKKDPDAARVAMLDAFASVAVMPSDLEALLGHTTERMNPAELDRLRKIYAAISQGETTWAEVLETAAKQPAKPEPAATTTSAPAAQGATNAAPAPASSPAQPAPAASKPPRGSKGTAGLKDKLKDEQPAAPATAPAPKPDEPVSAFEKAAGDARARDIARRLEEQNADPAMKEPEWMVGETRGASPTGGQPVASEPDLVERPCAGCGVPIDVVATDPPGQKCYACRNA